MSFWYVGLVKKNGSHEIDVSDVDTDTEIVTFRNINIGHMLTWIEPCIPDVFGTWRDETLFRSSETIHLTDPSENNSSPAMFHQFISKCFMAEDKWVITHTMS